MSVSKKKRIVNIQLDQEDAIKLDFIKKHYNIKKDTDAVRLCINDAFRIATERNRIFKNIGEPKPVHYDEDTAWEHEIDRRQAAKDIKDAKALFTNDGHIDD